MPTEPSRRPPPQRLAQIGQVNDASALATLRTSDPDSMTKHMKRTSAVDPHTGDSHRCTGDRCPGDQSPGYRGLAIGALAVGAVAIGTLALGRLVIGRLAIRRTRLGVVEIDELRVGRLHVRELVTERRSGGDNLVRPDLTPPTGERGGETARRQLEGRPLYLRLTVNNPT